MSELGTHNGDGIRYRMSLSAPKGGVAQMLRDPAGDWVPYSEYLEYLEKVGYPFWKKEAYELKAENARLKAEVERLRKAGDAMAFNYESMSNAVSVYDCDLMKYVDRWNAAKEGKQS